MMKKFFALLMCLTVMCVATACGSKNDAPAQDTDNSQLEATETEDTASESEEAASEEADPTGEDEEAAKTVFTGILEEKKDFMVVVAAEDQSASYLFNLADGVTCDAEVGDKVSVTYTGDMEVPVADQDLTASAIELAE